MLVPIMNREINPLIVRRRGDKKLCVKLYWEVKKTLSSMDGSVTAPDQILAIVNGPFATTR
jgi:hypothetical protein